MAQAITFTIAEAVTVLDPPMTERQLRQIITALGWKPAGYRHDGRPGHPWPVYDSARIFGLHAALLPFMGEAVVQCA
jgi:hypothetical protein